MNDLSLCLFLIYRQLCRPMHGKVSSISFRSLIQWTHFHEISFDFSLVVVMFISVVVVTVLGTAATGGFVNIFEKASEGNRIILFK